MQHEYHPATSAAILVVPESLWGVIGPPEKPVATAGFASKPPGVWLRSEIVGGEPPGNHVGVSASDVGLIHYPFRPRR